MRKEGVQQKVEKRIVGYLLSKREELKKEYFILLLEALKP